MSYTALEVNMKLATRFTSAIWRIPSVTRYSMRKTGRYLIIRQNKATNEKSFKGVIQFRFLRNSYFYSTRIFSFTIKGKK